MVKVRPSRVQRVSKEVEREEKQRISRLVFVAEALDGYRSGKYTSPTAVEQALQGLGLKDFPKPWKSLRKIVSEVYESILLRQGRKYVNYLRIGSELTRGCFFALFIPLLGLLIAPRDPRVITASYLTLYLILVLLYIALVLKSIGASRMSKLLREASTRNAPKLQVFKEATQYVLDRLREELRKAKAVDYRTVKLRLLNTDYRGIIVLRQPTRFRPYYEVILEVYR